MKQGESKIVYGVANRAGNVFIDSFQNTQKFAQDVFAASSGKSWEQCEADGMVCLPYRITLEAVQ